MSNEYDAIDLGDAWMEWKDTCALALCSPVHRNALEGIARNKFSKLLLTLPKDKFSDFSNYIDDPDKLIFHEIETELYLRQKIKGIPFKDYLFDYIARREGNMAGNLTGYVIKCTFRSIIHNSIHEGKSSPPAEEEDKSDNAEEDRQNWRLNRNSLEAELSDKHSGALTDHDAEQLITRHMNSWDFDTTLALLCFAFKIPLSNSQVRQLAKRNKSAFAVLPEKAQQPLIEELQQRGYDAPDILKLYQKTLIPKLEQWLKNHPECQKLFENLGK